LQATGAEPAAQWHVTTAGTRSVWIGCRLPVPDTLRISKLLAFLTGNERVVMHGIETAVTHRKPNRHGTVFEHRIVIGVDLNQLARRRPVGHVAEAIWVPGGRPLPSPLRLCCRYAYPVSTKHTHAQQGILPYKVLGEFPHQSFAKCQTPSKRRTDGRTDGQTPEI